MARRSKTRPGRGVLVQRWARNAGILVLDVAVACVAFTAAFLTVHGHPDFLATPALGDKTLGFALLCIMTFFVFGTHRGAWRYVSLPDLVTMVKAALAAVVVYTVASFLLTRGQNVPRSVPVLTFIFLVSGLVGMRLAYRIAMEHLAGSPLGRGRRRVRRPVILCGLTDKAEGFLRSVRREPESGFEVIGILDDAPGNANRLVHGIRVLGRLADLEAVVSRLADSGREVRELVVTEGSPSRRRLADIVQRANDCSLTVSAIPDLNDVLSLTNGSLMQPKPIDIGDLLERPEVAADTREVAGLIEGRVVLATGAGGSIGSELSRQIAEFAPSRLVITDASEFLLYTLDIELRDIHPELEIVTRIVDVRDRRRVDAVFEEFRPEVVFHAAALKHVPLMEENPLEAMKTNLIGTRNVADAALANEAASFVMISTDKVVNPTNIMGATKRAAETYCQSLDAESETTRFKTVRFGNVLGSNGSVVPRFRDQIAAGGPVSVTHPGMMRYFMTIPEAVSLVLHACAHSLNHQSERGRIMVLDMGRPVRIADLAERMIQLAGFRPGIDIEIVYSGLRPGEKLVEELFDPSEIRDGRTEEGYVLAAPRFADRKLLSESLRRMEAFVDGEQVERAVHLLQHVVPEFRWHRDVVTSSERFGPPAPVAAPLYVSDEYQDNDLPAASARLDATRKTY